MRRFVVPWQRRDSALECFVRRLIPVAIVEIHLKGHGASVALQLAARGTNLLSASSSKNIDRFNFDVRLSSRHCRRLLDKKPQELEFVLLFESIRITFSHLDFLVDGAVFWGNIGFDSPSSIQNFNV